MPIVLLDTNVWVSAFINPHGLPARLRDAWMVGQFDVVVSIPLLEEIADVLTRPRIQAKYGLSTGYRHAVGSSKRQGLGRPGPRLTGETSWPGPLGNPP